MSFFAIFLFGTVFSPTVPAGLATTFLPKKFRTSSFYRSKTDFIRRIDLIPGIILLNMVYKVVIDDIL